ncbi:MAG: amidohydrolase [Pseudomonadota bacterium]
MQNNNKLAYLPFLAFFLLALSACNSSDRASGQTIIYAAKSVITMEKPGDTFQAVVVQAGKIVALGDADKLAQQYPGAVADESLAEKFIVPGFIDPHIHMMLSAIQYALPIAPPWPMTTPEGFIEGLATREAFLQRVREIEASTEAGEPLIIYGYHDLVHGDLDRHDLDAITTSRPLLIWHYSSHDFYLNTEALEWTEIDASLHDQFEGVPLDADGLPTGRIFEDALPYLTEQLGSTLLNPFSIRRGVKGFSRLLRQGGVTTVADLAYGIFSVNLENLNIWLNWGSPQKSGYRLYLVPEHRAFEKKYGDERIQEIHDLVKQDSWAPAPVLPQVKFFTDAAFYSQTMRLSDPGYLSGQTQGSPGLWVIKPENLVETIKPYWQAGLGVRIHSNGDAAQTETLNALVELRKSDKQQRYVIEHAGLFSPTDIARAAKLKAVISAASHYVFFLGEAYQAPLGAERGGWISPLASLSQAGVPVTLHSDAPLAPPLPLQAGAVHMTRATREGGSLSPNERLPAYEALEAITLDAAIALGLEDELGSISVGKRADFTVLDANPMETPGSDWPDIGVWGVVLDGVLRPN